MKKKKTLVPGQSKDQVKSVCMQRGIRKYSTDVAFYIFVHCGNQRWDLILWNQESWCFRKLYHTFSLKRDWDVCSEKIWISSRVRLPARQKQMLNYIQKTIAFLLKWQCSVFWKKATFSFVVFFSLFLGYSQIYYTSVVDQRLK